MLMSRRVALAVLAVAAVAVWFVLEPVDEQPPSEIDATSRDYLDLIDTALSDFEANERRADSAPQQQVVAGWVIRDLETIQAYQSVDLLEAVGALGGQEPVVVRDDRTPALLLIGVLAIVVIGATSPVLPSYPANLPERQTTRAPSRRGPADDQDPLHGEDPGVDS